MCSQSQPHIQFFLKNIEDGICRRFLAEENNTVVEISKLVFNGVLRHKQIRGEATESGYIKHLHLGAI